MRIIFAPYTRTGDFAKTQFSWFHLAKGALTVAAFAEQRAALKLCVHPCGTTLCCSTKPHATAVQHYNSLDIRKKNLRKSGDALEQSAQQGGGITIPGGI